MQKIEIELSENEIAALKDLAKQRNQSLKTMVEMSVAETLVRKGLITESAERGGNKYVRLEE